MGEICIGARLAESVFSLKNEADAGSTQEAYSPSSSSSIQSCRAQNSHDMSVTPDVSQVEMWPYVDSAAVGPASENHAATAVLIVPSVMVPPLPPHLTAASQATPHDVDSQPLS